ncbi:MAG: oligosaccharide flippase family protein [Actinomycetia bacterium]|nr:oligosaccharide flippase family protein [Actinomycetes bacterium]
MKGGAIYGAGTMLQAVTTLAAMPALTQLLGPAEFGLVATGQMVLQLLTFLAGLGFTVSIGRDYFLADDGHLRARCQLGTIFLIAPAVALLAHLTSSWWVRAFDEVSYGTALTLAVAAAAARTTTLGASALLRAREQALAFVGVSLLSTVGGMGLGLALTALDPQPSSFFAGLLLGNLASSALGAVWARPAAPWSMGRDPLWSAFRLGAPTIPHSLAGLVLVVGDRVLVERYLGLDDVGRYQVAYLIGGFGVTGLASFNNAWAPIIHGADESERWSTLRRTGADVVQATALLATGLALAAPLALGVAAGGDYDPSSLAPTAAIVALTAVPYSVYLSGSHVLFALRRTGWLAVLTPAAALLNIGLNMALLDSLELVGAALATLVTYIVWSLAVATVASRTTKPLLPTSALARALAVATVGGTLAIFLPPDGLGLATRLVLATALVSMALSRFALSPKG